LRLFTRVGHVKRGEDVALQFALATLALIFLDRGCQLFDLRLHLPFYLCGHVPLDSLSQAVALS
jgi:hypothetical protein